MRMALRKLNTSHGVRLVWGFKEVDYVNLFHKQLEDFWESEFGRENVRFARPDQASSVHFDTMSLQNPHVTSSYRNRYIVVGQTEAWKVNRGGWRCFHTHLTRLTPMALHIGQQQLANLGPTTYHGVPAWRIRGLRSQRISGGSKHVVYSFLVSVATGRLLHWWWRARDQSGAEDVINGQKRHAFTAETEWLRFSHYGEKVNVHLPSPCPALP
jgi:hypothetical protein